MLLYNLFRMAVSGAIAEVVVGSVQEVMPKKEDGSAKSVLADVVLTIGGLVLTGAIVNTILPKVDSKKDS